MALYFEDFESFPIGHTWLSPGRTIGEADINLFAGMSGDLHPQHTDARYGKASPYGERIAHGYLTASIASGLVYRIGLDEGTSHALLGIAWKFQAPVLIGDTIEVLMALTGVRASRRHPDFGIVERRYTVRNQHGATVATGDVAVLFKRRPGAAGG